MSKTLPVGWEEKTLGEVCSFNRGLTYKKSDEVPLSSNVVLRANNIDLSTNSLNFDELKYLSPNFEIPTDKIVQKNCLLVCTASGSKSHLGKVALIDKDYGYAFGGFMGLLLPNQFIDSHYLFYALTSKSYFDFVSHLTDGANINNLKWSQLQDFKLPIPPLSEQKRIVEKLDKILANIDKAKENTKKNLQNAKEVFESYLEEVFTKNISLWTKKKLSEISELKQSKEEAKRELKDSDLVSFVPMEFLGIGKKYFSSDKKQKLKDLIKNYTYFAENDLIIAKITPCFENGKIGIAKNLSNGIGFGSSEYVVLRPNEEVCVEYLYYFFNRNSFRKEGSLNMKGAVGHRRVAKEFFENYILTYPSKKEQQKIVQQLDKLQEYLNKLEQIYTRKLADLDELKQSILQQAFSGKL